jgi:hypothetical protein
MSAFLLTTCTVYELESATRSALKNLKNEPIYAAMLLSLRGPKGFGALRRTHIGNRTLFLLGQCLTGSDQTECAPLPDQA